MIFALFSISIIFSLHQKNQKGQNTLSKIQLPPDPHQSPCFRSIIEVSVQVFLKSLGIFLSLVCCAVLSHSVVSDSLQPYGLQPARLLYPWGFSRQEQQSGLPCPPPGDLPNPGLPCCRQILYHLSHQGSPIIIGLAKKFISVFPIRFYGKTPK